MIPASGSPRFCGGCLRTLVTCSFRASAPATFDPSSITHTSQAHCLSPGSHLGRDYLLDRFLSSTRPGT